MVAKHILIVEDEAGIRNYLSDILEDAGFAVTAAADGLEGALQFQKGGADLILLDIMLPKIDGHALLELIRRQSDVSVIFLTAMGTEADQIKGFDLLADDYIVKPSTAALIVKRVEAALRRSEAATAEDPGKFTCGALCLDTKSYTAQEDGSPIPLTLTEFELLRLLLENRGIVLTREVILNHVWGIDYFGDDRVVNVHLANLRRKLKGGYIETVRGVGYKFHEAN